jgi:PAS domain-containing protein
LEDEMAGERDRLEEPTLWIDAEGQITGANEAAVKLLGLELEALRALPPGSLAAERTDPEEQAALLEQWQAAGGDALAGFTTIRRGDGARLRIAFAIAAEPDGSYVATLNPAPGANAAETVVYTVGEVLGRWRAAERRLQALAAESHEYGDVRAEVESLRTQYQRLFEARARAS